MSLGTERVRTDFNPGILNEDTEKQAVALIVQHIKAKSADLIDYCEGLKEKDPRLAALAQTAYEEAAMWAVKAATG
ncbi:MAG: hypothetical protein V3W37_07925 [Candidatus Binatia bacterium]